MNTATDEAAILKRVEEARRIIAETTFLPAPTARAETLALMDEADRALRQRGSRYLYAGNPACEKCDAPLGATDECPACTQWRRDHGKR